LMKLADMDENGDGVLDKEEFMYRTRDTLDSHSKQDKQTRVATYKYAESIYDTCDLDGDGVLNERELEFATFLSSSALQAAREAGTSVRPDLESFVMDVAEEFMPLLDKNRDGRIDLDEFVDAAKVEFKGWGMREEGIESAEMQTLLHHTYARADVTGDGFLSAREMQYGGYLVFRLAAQTMSDSLLESLDQDGNGRIELAELNARLEGVRPRPDGVRATSEYMRDEFGRFDQNGDGGLDRGELFSITSQILSGSAGAK